MDRFGLQGIPGVFIGVGVDLTLQLFSNGGDLSKLNVNELFLAGVTGFFLPGGLKGLGSLITEGVSDTALSAGAGVFVRGFGSLSDYSGGPIPPVLLGDLLPIQQSPTINPLGSLFQFVDTSGPYPTGPGVCRSSGP
jgi:hypothetical protein